MSKYWIKTAVIVILFLAVAVLIAGLLVSANTFRPALESQLSQVLGRQVALGNLGFSPFTGSLVASNVAIAEDPAFGTAPFLQAKSLRIGVKLRPLLFDRKLVVTSFTAVSPAIRLVRSASGVWNFSSIGHAGGEQGAGAPAQSQSAFPDLTVGKIKISGGTATVSSLPEAGKPLVYSNLSLSAQHFSMVKSFPFQVSATLPGGGSLAVEGTAGPADERDASDTPLNAKIDLKHFDPVAAGVVDAGQGVAMLADISAQVDSDGKTLAANGTVNASHLKLAANGVPAPSPVEVRFLIHDNLASRSGTIDSLNFGTGAVRVSAAGSYSAATQPMTLDLQVSAPNVPVDQIEALLPALGVRLPSGSSLKGGTLTASLKITGPANGLTIVGPVEIDNTRLAGFDLGSKIDGLHPVSGSQGGTAIRELRTDVTSSPAGARIENLYASVPALGTATGSGTVSPAGSLDFHILAKLDPGSGAAGQALSGLGASALGSLVSAVAAKGIPIDISGTTANPVIRADVNGMLKQNASGLLKQGVHASNPGSLLNKFLPR